MGKADTVLLTQAEYARHRKALGLSGGTRESVRKAVDRKSISTFGDGLIDPELADVQWARALVNAGAIIVAGDQSLADLSEADKNALLWITSQFG